MDMHFSPMTLVCGLTLWSSIMTGIVSALDAMTYPTKSGIPTWVDTDTPKKDYVYYSSRGRRWDLTMSDEFNVPNRSFRAGDDHMWTSLEKPDGVNGALEIYSHNMTSTACDDDGTCYFYIETIDEVTKINVYNMYTHPPSFNDVYFWYRGGMVQSWNKFCYQGGMLEVRAQLPGAVTPETGNPDIALGPSGKTSANRFYPTWPGIWMLGNLGRAIFSASTNRMWPFTYNECDPDVFEPSYQRISACDDNPGYGLNPNQGRGAPEIDILEGGGVAISSSIQIGPGMPKNYRLFDVNTSLGDPIYCLYGFSCQTLGANYIDVPTDYYQRERGHKSWYQGLRYAANNYCAPNDDAKQSYETIENSLEQGITENFCSVDTCPASGDVHSDLSFIDNRTDAHWGINSNATPPSGVMSPFNYQMDALSANWPIHFGAYTNYYEYQVEWVTGKNGYVRWLLHGEPLFEITSDVIENVPQDTKNSNPKKIMIEEPLYVIFNVALSSSWGAMPPNPGRECRGDGLDDVTNKICDAFPMYLKIDYIRLYQDLGDDLEPDNYMTTECDPATHPTKEWINGHIDEYEDNDNKVIEVAGKASCRTSDDCTIGGTLARTALKTGKCVNKRCECLYESWGGPRCTTAIAGSRDSESGLISKTYGPPLAASIALAIAACLLSATSIYVAISKSTKHTKILTQNLDAKTAANGEMGHLSDASNHRVSSLSIAKENLRQSFV
ncbi:Concanavalin A-like lectin/glucanase, subgroup [Plasmopara halstedii]|uniref:Concanavalin A-like lectin/glucanase, subgroup n=1 Tax=Plasmopara halstedii TaxID=4781 RepID=A0A0P1AH65_PLAHL|nr:Concanavalin A-like lectin/glucanase, subgroup [Plasmopara halstedii]CEG40031.1 Concanavalin A-like lectin/glucanase, subgroup [Plasmopara halstedii]|eukprot:XP_024576400.1 Concanavalin A-like lectin/glucanase, subgroup [Plasmopara halstedii]